MTLPTFHEYCTALGNTVTRHLIGGDVTLSGDELQKITEDLKMELRQAYHDSNYPNGESDENMVEWLLKNMQFEIEGESEES